MKCRIAVFVAIVACVMISLPSLVSAQGMEVRSAKVRLSQGEYDKAEALLITALEKNPKHNDANYYMGALKYQQGNYEKTLDHWDLITYKDLGKRERKQYDGMIEDLWRISFNKAVELFGQRDWDGAVSNFKISMRANPDDQQAPMNLGLALMNAQRTDEAIEVLEKVAEADPKNVNAWDGLAMGYVRNSDYPNIIRAYTQFLALTDQPDNISYYQLARAHTALGDTMKAAEVYESGYEAIPDEMDFYLRASEIRSQFGQNDQAVKILQKARSVDPTNASVLNYLGTVHYIMKQYQDAIEPLEVYLQMEPKSIDGWETLGNAYYGLANQARDKGDSAKEKEFSDKGQEYIDKSKELMRTGEGK